ncbi:MAG: hypothetical protein HY835_03665 [Anaerolineae bacterium]|nr:hypothetical protein [Anaerolineae bacterium]
MFSEEVRQTILVELDRASTARQQGFEGRARVCARRAAGAAAREFLALRGFDAPISALDALKALPTLPDLSPTISAAVALLLQQVDENFNLPEGTDLLALARDVANQLENNAGRNRGEINDG